MPKLSQKSFVNGQYDRIAQNQESINGGGIVASGLSYAKNILSSDKGELRKRLGTKFLKKLDRATVLIPFRMNDENDIVLIANSDKIKGFKFVDGELEQLLSARPDATVSFPDRASWPDGTVATGSVSSGNWTLSFSFYNTITGLLGSQRPGWLINGNYVTTDWRGYIVQPEKRIAPQNVVISNSTTASCLRVIKFIFFTTSATGTQYQYWTNPVIQYSDNGNDWFGVQTDYSVGEYIPLTNSQGGYASRCTMTIKQTNYAGKHKYWRVYFQSGTMSQGVFIDSVSFVDPGVTELFDKNSPYTEEQLKNIKYSQDKNQMFIACEDVIPYRLVNNTGELTFGSFTPANTSTIWSTMGGYPAAVSMFQNRVWFGGFQNNPATVIASKFGDYETFNSSSPAQKDDYLNLRCNQLKTKIRNMVGGQNVMCCFSEDGISYVDGGSTGLIATNENIEFKLKNRMPAGNSTPGFKDDVMLYSSSDGTKLYGVDFDLLVNRFQVSDLAKYAKDITKAKITELHYVNNESKLVYGLTEEGTMFALLYEKGQYQGFFPLDFGGMVYDICPVKVGRNYKLLMVVFRDGEWYLEEKLDMGNYIDTSTPRLTDEEKKWATYDNLENNIALDCYQSYDESFNAEIQITDETHILSNIDLSNYVGKSIMLCNDNSKEFTIFSIDSMEIVSNWTQPKTDTKLISLRNIGGLKYINNQFVVIGEQGDYTCVLTSNDGINWTDPYDIQSMYLMGADSIAYNGSVYVLFGSNRHITSSDLINWNAPIYDANMATHRWLAVSSNNGMFFAVSLDGYVSTSNNGSTWTTPTENTNLGNNKYWRSIATDGSKFVLLGNDGDISTSTNGTTWTASIKPVALSNKVCRSIVYDSEKFIILTADGCISTSNDGINWTEPVLDFNLKSIGVPHWMYLAYNDSKLLALTDSYVDGGSYNNFYSINQGSEIGTSYYKCQGEISANRGSTIVYSKVYSEFTEFMPNLPQVSNVAVISEGRYFNTTKPDENGKIYLPAPCHKVIYGVPYESVAIIKLQAPYESLKNIAQVDLSVIDSTHLEVGTNFEDTQNIEKIDDSSYYDLTRITMNDTYRLVLSDTPETTKNLILRSNKGVPFTVIAVDMYVNYSNLGGD